MKKAVLVSVVLLIMFIIISQSAQTQRKTIGHSEWVAKSLSEIQTVKVGMNRRDLLKLFTVEGGVSNRRTRTYVYRECPYIKVDVGFELVGMPNDKLTEHMEDRITRISKPYLEQSVID